jgi:hypothetical protein
VRLDLDEPVDAIAPGQAGVLYDGDLVLGGGTVATTGPIAAPQRRPAQSPEAT